MAHINNYTLHSRGDNWFHFRISPYNTFDSFSITYCHDGSVCMTGDMGCLVWQREYFPKKPDYGFPYPRTGIDYFAEKIVRAGESQVIWSWNQDAAIRDIKEALSEDRDEEDREVLSRVYDRLSGFESGEYGYFQMLEEFDDLSHSIEGEELCEFGRDYSDPLKQRFEMLKSVSDLIIVEVGLATDTTSILMPHEKRDCAKCVHVSTPKGKQCYTLTRRLKELVSDAGREFAPEFVIPAMDQIAAECKRYREAMTIRTCIFCDAVHDASKFDEDWDIDGCPECDNKALPAHRAAGSRSATS